MLKEIAKTRGDDPPGYSELVFEPTAPAFLSAFGKFFPQFIDFFLSRDSRLSVKFRRLRSRADIAILSVINNCA